MDLLVDPIVYALPMNSKMPDAHIEYLEHLLEWRDEFIEQHHSCFVSDACLIALYDCGRYPSENNLRQLWNRYGEEDISFRDVARVCRRLLEKRPPLEGRVKGLRNLEVCQECVFIHPDLLERHQGPVLEAFRKTLGLLAFARSTNGDSTESNIQLITYPIENGPHAELAAATVDKKEVKTSVYLFFSPDDLLAFVDIKDCWKDTDLALKLVQQGLIKQNSLPAEGCLIEYHVAPSFNESISTNHYDRRSDQLAQIFRKCVLLLSGESPPDGHSHHPLDKHKQRRFNDWKAWRLHITGSPIAIRLHYWRRGNEIILMQVGPHENMDINAPPEDLR